MGKNILLNVDKIRNLKSENINYDKLNDIHQLTYDRYTKSWGCTLNTNYYNKNVDNFNLVEFHIYKDNTLYGGPVKVHFFRKRNNKLCPYVFDNFLDESCIKSKEDSLIQQMFLTLIETIVKKGGIVFDEKEKN